MFSIIKKLAHSILHMHFIPIPITNLEEPIPLTEQLPIQNHRVRSKSGNTLGVWTTSDSKPKRIFIFIHGQLGNRAQTHRKQAMKFLAIEFQSVVANYDPSGYGDSEGFPSSENLRLDAMSILEFCRAKFPDLPVYVWGHSLGGPVATYLAKEAGLGHVQGLIIDGSFNSLADVLSESVVWGVFGLLGTAFARKFATLLFENEYDTGLFLPHVKVPVFLLHGANDWVVPPSSILRLRSNCKETAEICLVAGAGHNDLHTGVWGDVVGPRIKAWMSLH